jgi:ankyrin repeat/BTB/POZ domain-containing protein 2
LNFCFFSAISVAAAHGQRSVLHKLLSHPLNGSPKKEMLSLEEILAEGSNNSTGDRRAARLLVSIWQFIFNYLRFIFIWTTFLQLVPACVDDSGRSSTMSSVSDCAQVLKLTKSQVKALQEAMYHSAESRHLGMPMLKFSNMRKCLIIFVNF